MDLEYLSTIFLNFEIGKPPRLDYQWTYFGGDEIFSRVTRPGGLPPSTVPAGKSGLCVEVTCRQGDARWQNPESLKQPVIDDLVRTEHDRRRRPTSIGCTSSGCRSPTRSTS